MSLFELKLGKLKIPAYDIGALVAGFYIGYAEGKGIDVSTTVEYLTKYGPTALALVLQPLFIFPLKRYGKRMIEQAYQDLQKGHLKVKLEDGTEKRYWELTEKEKQEETPKIVKGLEELASKCENQKYLKPTAVVGARTAVETMIGYTAGRLFSQFN